MIKKNAYTLLFLVILIVATIVRFWNLGNFPALNADEAAIGYNALSLIETGKDEHGNPWPVHLQSFNDYKPGAYFYIVLPFVKLFGLSEWSVRVPNAFFGVASVLLIYLLCQELFKDNREKSKQIGILSALFLAISPWHIHFSRGGWEVNTASFFILSGVYLFIKYVSRGKIVYLAISALAFLLSLYAYHAARIVVPLLGIGILLIWRKSVKQGIKRIAVIGLLSAVLLLPLASDLLRGQVSSRAVGVGLFADPGPLSRVNEQRGEHNNFSGIVAKLYHNKLVNYGLAFADNWAAHYHGEFLFLSGDVIERNRVPETGQMYILDALWISFGLWWMVKNIKTKAVQLVLFWLIIAPTAAALTFQSPHALRAQNMIIPLVIICSIGFSQAISWIKNLLKNKYTLYGFYLLIGLMVFLQFIRYEHMYWIHMAKEYKFSSQYGVKELVEYIKTQPQTNKVLVTDRYDQPYILFLFYLGYPPSEFQKNHVLLGKDKFGFSTVPAFDRYEFSSINFDTDRQKYPGYLIAGTPEEIPDEANIIKRIYGANGKLYFEVVAN